MKKVFYSRPLKIFAVLALIFTAAAAVFEIFYSMQYLWNCGGLIYCFEKSPDYSRHIASEYLEPYNAVADAYSAMSWGDDMPSEGGADGEYFAARLSERLSYIDAHKAEYYISINGKEYANCEFKTSEDFQSGEFFLIYSHNKTGHSDLFSTGSELSDFAYYTDDFSMRESGDEITVYSRLTDSYAAGLKTLWYEQSEFAMNKIKIFALLAAAALALIVYLIAVCGRTADADGVKTARIDRAWTELRLAALTISVIMAICLIVIVGDSYFDSNYLDERLACALFVTLAAAGGALLELFGLSLVRSAKAKEFFKRSIICKIIIKTFEIAKHCAKRLILSVKRLTSELSKTLFKGTTAVLITLLTVYTLIMLLCGIIMTDSALGLFICAVFFTAVCVIFIRRAYDTERIKKGVKLIKGGALSYRITDVRFPDLKPLSEDINDIGEGLFASVSDKLKAERMKTELITNVSHDLKTPLTSIINYAKLLEEMELSPAEASDYVKIIAKKSSRLKELTSDLFEISRVNSGNETLNLETLDVSLLINQSLAEHEAEINASGLQICLQLKENLSITADGKKMSRVISNLISNFLKYTMKGTRVFIKSYAEESRVIMEFMNVSAYPIEFDSAEITERFVRADKSRSEEGNGLGLAIAKSYTEACGGTFKVETDGDVFKAVMIF